MPELSRRALPDAAAPARTLVALAEQAAACVPATCGAVATMTLDASGAGAGPDPAEPPPAGVTHPDLAPLLHVQWERDEGPIPAAVRTGEPAGADDLLRDDRWPAYRAVALDAGVRSCATLPFRYDGVTVTVTLCGFRPGAVTGGARRAAALIGELAARGLASDQRYERALTEVDQLDAAMRTRPVVDQACGILMHLTGCDAGEAFTLLRRQSQRRNRKLADVAAELVETRGRLAGGETAGLSA